MTGTNHFEMTCIYTQFSNEWNKIRQKIVSCVKKMYWNIGVALQNLMQFRYGVSCLAHSCTNFFTELCHTFVSIFVLSHSKGSLGGFFHHQFDTKMEIIYFNSSIIKIDPGHQIPFLRAAAIHF